MRTRRIPRAAQDRRRRPPRSCCRSGKTRSESRRRTASPEASRRLTSRRPSAGPWAPAAPSPRCTTASSATTPRGRRRRRRRRRDPSPRPRHRRLDQAARRSRRGRRTCGVSAGRPRSCSATLGAGSTSCARLAIAPSTRPASRVPLAGSCRRNTTVLLAVSSVSTSSIHSSARACCSTAMRRARRRSPWLSTPRWPSGASNSGRCTCVRCS
mmetsp:Transcript_115502/g.331514  ORF Transcript_115502/g.331514 Transcript_115502/m.331514 type:complete len:212 (-) Transcript_115502:803-1438(-)